MDVPAMHLEQHERGIHVVRSGIGGARVTEVSSDVCAAARDQQVDRDTVLVVLM
jgi:hypothetical protein